MRGGGEAADRNLGERAGLGSGEGGGEGRGMGWGVPKGGGQVAGGGEGGAQHYGPRGWSGLQVPILVRGRPPRRG